MIKVREITGRRMAVLVAIAVLLFIPLNSSAEVTFTSLAPLEHGLKLPEDVAVAPDGTTYAVDGSQGLIMLYNSIGAPTGNIWISKPTSVAVSANGLIYVGTNENLSVKILDPSYNIIGSLGSGAGEFKLPRNIAIDKATGNVYVVDQIDQSIKVYTSSGTFVKKINDYPNLPQDVTIMNNKLYVIDHPLITDPWGGKIRGAKVRVFDMEGNVLDDETFGTYGDQEGKFVRPAGITSDTDGKLYISDSFHGVVMCFTSDGNYLGAIQNPSKPMVTPMGIALGEDRRLLVASLNTASIHAFGLRGRTIQSTGTDFDN
ncbi:MAG: NHL repeat-containing protein [Candidatus Hermodarchaeia archaeon]|jgi:DNA-binding beta-propeller fold protein YncE